MMADSTCLMQPFSYASGFANETMEGNHPAHALGQSVSFGRFMSESLAWEKWSTFSHNRYVEEAERYSRPGSVAQKKAFFEAHYKKIAAQKAAALLEQANATANPVPETESEDRPHEAGCVDAQPPISASNGDCQQEIVVAIASAENGGEAIAHQVLEENLQRVDMSKGLAENELNQTPQMEKSLSKSPNRRPEPPAAMGKKKADSSSSSSSSSKLLLFNRASKISATPAKPAPTCFENATPIQDKRKSTPKSLRMAVSFTPIRELNKLTSTVMRKIERSRVGSSSSKAAKDCSTPLKTPNTALKCESQNHPSATPWSEKKRNKLYSPFSFTPFSLRTEERAARRKEKLEEKFNTNDSQKVQLQTKLKEKAETEIRKLRQTFCFKARPLPDFYKDRKTQKNSEVPMPQIETPKLGRKTNPSNGERAVSESGRRPPARSSSSKNKNVQGKSHSLSLRTVMSAHENTSPNIQQ